VTDDVREWELVFDKEGRLGEFVTFHETEEVTERELTEGVTATEGVFVFGDCEVVCVGL